MTTEFEVKRATQESRGAGRGANIALWVIQGLLAALFLFSGTMKWIMPIQEMTKQVHLPGWFLHFIGVAEILGGIGLVLPWAFGIRRYLTVIAAYCLIVIMVGATVITLKIGGGAQALLPAITGVLLAVVAYGRRSALNSGTKKIGDTVDLSVSRSTNQ